MCFNIYLLARVEFSIKWQLPVCVVVVVVLYVIIVVVLLNVITVPTLKTYNSTGKLSQPTHKLTHKPTVRPTQNELYSMVANVCVCAKDSCLTWANLKELLKNFRRCIISSSLCVCVVCRGEQRFVAYERVCLMQFGDAGRQAGALLKEY